MRLNCISTVSYREETTFLIKVSKHIYLILRLSTPAPTSFGALLPIPKALHCYIGQKKARRVFRMLTNPD